MVARPTGTGQQAVCLIAYKMYHEDGKSIRQIAKELDGPPYFCGSKSTAERWVNAGRRIVQHDTDGMNDPLRKRSIQRQVISDTIDAWIDKIDQDIENGLEGRAPLRGLQIRLLENYIHLHGLRRAPKPAGLKVTGDGGRPRVDPRLGDALGALLEGMTQQERDALIEELTNSPDGRHEP